MPVRRSSIALACLLSLAIGNACGSSGQQLSAASESPAPPPASDEAGSPASQRPAYGAPSTVLRPNFAANTPTATERVVDALLAARAHAHARQTETSDEAGLTIVDYRDSPSRRAWLLIDRAANLASAAAARPAPERAALLEARKAVPETWAPGALTLKVLHSGESITAQLYRADGTMDPGAIDTLSAALGDWRVNEVRSTNVRLLAILYLISRRFREPLMLVSGYRVRGVNASQGSRHGAGRAADIRVAGVSSYALAEFVESHFCQVGVGIYPNSGFVHVDVRQRSYFWLDRSDPGGRSREQPRSPRAVADCERDLTLKTPRINERLYYPEIR